MYYLVDNYLPIQLKLIDIDSDATEANITNLIARKDSDDPHLNMNQLLKIMDDKDIQTLYYSKNERLFRLNFVNYCCVKYLQLTKDETLMAYMDDNIDSGWVNIELDTIQTVCKEPEMVVCPKS